MNIKIVLLCLLTCVACDRRSKLLVDNERAPVMMANRSDAAEGDNDVDPQASPQVERKLIKTGELTFEADDVKKTKAEVEKICKEITAYISTETQNNYNDRLQITQTIRVPAARFEELILKIEPLAEKVDSKNINSQDVTEEFIDVEARLQTKKELEARYREILKKANTVTDILAIENQIGGVRAEIESMEGRLNYLKSQVSLSTLTLTYYENIGTDFGFFSKFGRSMGEGWDNLLAFLIALTSVWPFVIAFAGAWFWWRRTRRKKAPVE